MPSFDDLRQLTKEEATAVWGRCHEISDDEIGKPLFIGAASVAKLMTSAYSKLGYPSDMHSAEKSRRFKADYCHFLPQTLEEFIALLMADTAIPAPIPPVRPIPIDPDQPENDRGLLRGCGITLAVIAVVAVLACIIYFIIHPPFPPAQPTPALSPQAVIPPSEIPTQPGSTLAPTIAAVLPSLTSISSTEVPTSAPIPTPSFYEQGQPAALRDGVTVTLQNNFVDPNFGGCFSPKPGFVLEFLIHNSTGNQFLIRFDPTAFHAQDNSGTTYTLKGAGMYICNATGPQNYPGRSEEALYVSFAGQIPLSANYITITVDSLSGVRLVFHKLL